jgi:hypothetical protein
MDEEIHAEVLMEQQGPFPAPTQLMWVFWAYPFLSFILMGVNLFFIVHAIKTGRPYYWVWIIFVMPVIGALAYFIIEMRPNLRRIDWADLRWRFAGPQARLAVLNELVDGSPTVKNRMRLAREYETQARWSQAANTYRECLIGVFDNDPRLLICLASALLEEGDFERANEIASSIPEQRDFKLNDDRKLVLHRSQSAVGSSELAIAGLEELSTRKSGLAPRFYLAQAKEAAGRTKEAQADLQKIITTFRNGNALMRKHEQSWYLNAKRMLKK